MLYFISIQVNNYIFIQYNDPVIISFNRNALYVYEFTTEAPLSFKNKMGWDNSWRYGDCSIKLIKNLEDIHHVFVLIEDDGDTDESIICKKQKLGECVGT